MTCNKQHIWHCILFAFQLKKTTAEATRMIYFALREDVATYKKKSDSKDLEMAILIWVTKNARERKKNLKIKS